MVGLKAGEQGLYLRTSGPEAMADLGRGRPAEPAAWAHRELWAPAFRTSVVGTTGAGDATIAGFIRGLLKGLSPGETVRAACAVGTSSCEAADAVSGIPSWSSIEARIRHGWPHLHVPLDESGFRWQVSSGVWTGPGDGQPA
jgi:sugar/nucleoside kinase (ribokinase family)